MLIGPSREGLCWITRRWKPRIEVRTMLDNLTATEGIPSTELIRDIRTLCGLEKEQLEVIAEAFRSLPEEQTDDSIREALLPRIRALPIDAEELSSSIKVTLFLWKRWGSLGLTKEQVIDDLRSLEVPPDQVTNVEPLLDALELKLGDLHRQRIEATALATGNPCIDSALAVVDIRAVFESNKYDEDQGDEQAYFALDRFLPIAILEIVSELNDVKSTQTYLLTEKTLQEFCDILDRTKKRLETLKAKLPSPNSKGEERAN